MSLRQSQTPATNPVLGERHSIRQNAYLKTMNYLPIVDRLIDSFKVSKVATVWSVPNCQEAPKDLAELLFIIGRLR